jgi:hypothetical protein
MAPQVYTNFSPTPRQVGEMYEEAGVEYVVMIERHRTARGTYIYDVFERKEVEEWNGLLWCDYVGHGAPAYRLKADHSYVVGPSAPPPEIAAAFLGGGARTPQVCPHDQITDTGMGVGYCKTCPAKLRMVDFAWVVVNGENPRTEVT